MVSVEMRTRLDADVVLIDPTTFVDYEPLAGQYLPICES